MTRIRARRQTAIAGVLLGSACLSAPSPPRACGQATPPPDTTGFAALDLQDTLVVADASGSEPPRIVPIKNTNYPVPVGALSVSPLGRAENPGSQATPTTLEKVVVVLKQSKRLNDSKKIVSGTPPGELFAATGSVFRNNVLSNIRQGSTNPIFNAAVGPSAQMIAASDFNVFHRTSAPVPASVLRWSPDGKTPVDFATLAAFQNAVSGFESHSTAVEGQAVFLDEAKRDYRLRRSNALLSAAPLPPDIAAVAGRPVAIGYRGAAGQAEN